MTEAPPLSIEQQALVRSGQGVVRKAAQRIARRFALDEAALLGVAHEALIAAARTFDVSHGRPFESHAFTRVYGETFDFARAEKTSAALGAARRLRRFGLLAADAVLDDSDAFADDEATTRRRIDDECARIEAAVLAGFGSLASWPAADERLEAKELWHRTSGLLLAARAGLPEPQRELLALHYDRGESLTRAAELLGFSYRTAKRHHRAALDALRAAFAQDEEMR